MFMSCRVGRRRRRRQAFTRRCGRARCRRGHLRHANTLARAVGIGTYGLANMGTINDRLQFLTGTAAVRVRLAQEIQTTLEAIGREEKNVIIATDDAEIARFAASLKQCKEHLAELVTALDPM